MRIGLLVALVTAIPGRVTPRVCPGEGPCLPSKGLLVQCKEQFFSCVQEVDRIIEQYSSYYEVDSKKRAIVLTKSLSTKDRAIIARANTRLTKLVDSLSKCSPGDYDYMEVKEKYLPLAKELSHQLHTFVMQPLGISTLTAFDHALRILAPPLLVVGAILLVVTLKKLKLLPSWMCARTKTLFVIGAIVAASGILYNYKDQIFSSKKNLELFSVATKQGGLAMGADFAALVHRSETEGENVSELSELAVEVTNAVSRASKPAVPRGRFSRPFGD